MFKREFRKVISIITAIAMLLIMAGGIIINPQIVRADTSGAAVIGWDGDKDAVVAHMDGSFAIRDAKNITASFDTMGWKAYTQWAICIGWYVK